MRAAHLRNDISGELDNANAHRAFNGWGVPHPYRGGIQCCMRIAMRQYSACHADLGESGFAPTENIKIGIQYFLDMIRNLFVQKKALPVQRLLCSQVKRKALVSLPFDTFHNRIVFGLHTVFQTETEV